MSEQSGRDGLELSNYSSKEEEEMAQHPQFTLQQFVSTGWKEGLLSNLVPIEREESFSLHKIYSWGNGEGREDGKCYNLQNKVLNERGGKDLLQY